MVLHMAMKAALPNDLELLRGPDLPCSTNHAFALQQGSGSVLYGGIEFLASHYCAKWPVALKIWTKADCSGEQVDSSHRMGSSCSDYKIQTTNVWVPYVLCLISHFPLHSLLGSYIRAMWLRWSGSPNCSRRVEEVERILRLPCPRPLDFVKINLQDCELVYEFPEQVEDFSNFDIWPIFCCLRVWQIADIFEVGHTVGGKLILVSEHLAMLTIAAETIRLVCRESGWRGLYSPITHQTHIEATISGVGPYIIGISAVSARSTIFPDDALVVFLDSGVLQRGHGATLYSSSSPTSTRTCFIQRVCGLLGKIRPTGVPEHLREAYHNGKLMLEGQVGFTRAELGIVMPPPWWNETAVRAEICAYKRRLLRQSGQKRFPNCLRRTPLVQVSAWRLAESSLRQSQNLRDAHDAWQKYLTLSSKIKYDGCQAEHERSKLLEELRSWKLQFERQKSLCVEQSLQLDKTKSHVHDQEMAHADLIRSKLATESLLQKSIAAMKSTELERDNLKAANDALSSGKLSAEIAGQEGKSQLQTLIGRREAIKSEMRALKDLLETYSVVKTTCDEARAQNLVGKLHPGSTQHAAKALHLSKPTGDEMVHLHGSFPLLSV